MDCRFILARHPVVSFSFAAAGRPVRASSSRLSNVNKIQLAPATLRAQQIYHYLCPSTPSPDSDSISPKHDASIFRAIAQCTQSDQTQPTTVAIPNSTSTLCHRTSLSPQRRLATKIQIVTTFILHRLVLAPVLLVVRALLMCHENQTCLLIAEIGYENRRASHV
ncbi:hypothetical protein BKA64DRAFT_176584 [Cadophora sp. MPI-SDFR-AT-0126]|nr:hypothetical protein BKA64DRAFT_176584 [Leotiomycetes sp. MPI-SDFR-AT-0126]